MDDKNDKNHELVICDSGKLWEIVRRGLYRTEEVTSSGHWRPAPKSQPDEWVANVQASTPFGRQSKSWSELPPVPPVPPVPPTVVVRTPLQNIAAVEINILKSELTADDAKHAAREKARAAMEAAIAAYRAAENL